MATVVTREPAPAKASKKAAAAPAIDEEKGKNAKALFQAYQKAQDDVESARGALEVAMVARSAAVLAIKEALGIGPFQWRGATVTVSSRSTKGPDGSVASTNYFFKGIGGAVQTIE